jgi:hypothetical protein
MISFRAKFRIAVFCALGIFVSFPVHPAFAQDLLSDKCLQFACAQSTKHKAVHRWRIPVHCDGDRKFGNSRLPSEVTVSYDGKSSVTPFPYYSCACRQPDVAKITK